MARPWSRKHGDDDWWSRTDVARAWAPPASPEADKPPPRDLLAEHFGDDWRTSFGFDAIVGEERADEHPDAYRVLDLAPSATWEEIVAAHRDHARAHHPDLLVGRSPEERADGEERIRVINAAYHELRVRRGR